MTTTYETPPEQGEGRYWGATRISLGVVVVLIIAMWVWIYLFAPRDNPDRLATTSFTTAGEAICAPAQEQIDALPFVGNDTSPSERARGVEKGTAITIEMVSELERAAALVDDPDDLQLIEAWFADWHNYIEDRETYIVKLDSASADTPRSELAFTLRELASGGIYTRRIDGFANVNDMTSCHVPGDV